LTVYWFTMRESFGPSLGFGITAKDLDDALSLLAKAAEEVNRIQINGTMVESWREIKSADELEQNHVVPNMGVMLRRGVWFPNVPGVS
jgi:hypothetical protein